MEVLETDLSFGIAFDTIKGSVKELGMRLPNWRPDVVIKIQTPNENSDMTAPYLYVESRYGKAPWKETMIELFAENWEVVQCN